MGGMEGQQTDTARWVDLYADALYAYAFRLIPNAATAEDLVQETFVAALKGKERFAGRSSEKTWLIGILRNKIYDHLRRKYKEAIPLSNLGEGEVSLDSLYTSGGALKKPPSGWHLPSEKLEQEDFWRAFRECFKKLPHKNAESFSLRELEQASTKEICSILGVSATNLGVLLHRARLLLRQCLEDNWFKDHV